MYVILRVLDARRSRPRIFPTNTLIFIEKYYLNLAVEEKLRDTLLILIFLIRIFQSLSGQKDRLSEFRLKSMSTLFLTHMTFAPYGV